MTNVPKALRKQIKRRWKALRKDGPAAAAAAKPKRDVFGFYEQILGREHGMGLRLTRNNVAPGTLTWLIPDFNANSGGHINIFRMAKMLRERGFDDQQIVVMEPHRWSSANEAGALANAAFNEPGIRVTLGVDSIEPCRYLMATSWNTAYWVAKYRDAMHKCYFVQDFEPMFHPVGTASCMAEETYRLGLHGITAGSWLAEKLSGDYGMSTDAYSFSYDKHLYKPTERREHENRNIFFYARPVTERRCFDMGLLALKRVCEEVPGTAVIFAGWNVGDYEIPFHHLNAGQLPVDQLPDLYSQCETALVLSGSNLSLLPMEIAACNCPLVVNDGPNASWLLSEDEATYARMTPDALADAVIGLLRDPARAEAQAKRAMRRAQASDWGREADKVAAALVALDEARADDDLTRMGGTVTALRQARA